MELFLTPGRVQSFVDKPQPGGYKIYLTDGKKQWVELGGGGKTGNPHGLPRQRPLGVDAEEDAWHFVRELFSTHSQVAESPLDYHRLYTYAPGGELYFDRSIPLSSVRALVRP